MRLFIWRLITDSYCELLRDYWFIWMIQMRHYEFSEEQLALQEIRGWFRPKLVLRQSPEKRALFCRGAQQS